MAEHDRWARRRKHVFVLTSSGKPIFSRYGDALELSGLMGVFPALLARCADNPLRSMRAGDRLFVVLNRDPIYLVAVSSTGEGEAYLLKQLDYLFHQLLFVLTDTVLKTLQRRPGFDVRHMLGDAEAQLHGLIRTANDRVDMLFDSVMCVPLSHATRKSVTKSIKAAVDHSILYGILLTPDQLVTLVQPKASHLHLPLADVVMLLNFLRTKKRLHVSDVWLPFCLPHFNTSGHVHAYVSHMAPTVCLMLVSTESDAAVVPKLRACAVRARKALEETGALRTVATAGEVREFDVGVLGVPGLLHFVYHQPGLSQYTTSSFTSSRDGPRQRKRILRRYQGIRAMMTSASPPHRECCEVFSDETIAAMVQDSFELFAAFEPIVTARDVTKRMGTILQWVHRKERVLFAPKFETW